MLASHPSLRVIARVGVGVDSIDLAAATEHGIVVTIAAGANDATVADHTLALILASIRDIAGHDRRIRAGRWERSGPATTGQLTGSTVLIVGYGRIGRQVRERLRGFGVRVLVADPYAAADPGVEIVELDAALATADVVTIHTPLDASTRGLIGAAELALMSPGAILVNVARGGVVDEAALDAALAAGRLRAAALDVFESEPPTGSPLLERDRVTLTPHVGGLSHASIAAMLELATASVIDVLAGRRPLHPANPEVFEDHDAAATRRPAAR